MKSIDLNCDMGEREDLAPEVQEQLLACVTSANIACGAHAGSADLMRLTVRQALRRGVAIGAASRLSRPPAFRAARNGPAAR